MGTTTVWAFQELPELNNQTGFVSCDSDLAKRLIDENLVDDMRKGATLLRQITKVSAYSTKVMSAESKEVLVAKKKPRVRKDPAE